MAQSQSTPSDDQVNAIASQLYCPVCENITLDVCSTQACAQWRELIRQKLAQGETPIQIREYFVQQYGDRVLAVPPRAGLNWILYLLPPAIFLVALILMMRFIKSHQSANSEAVGPLSAADQPQEHSGLPGKEDQHD